MEEKIINKIQIGRIYLRYQILDEVNSISFQNVTEMISKTEIWHKSLLVMVLSVHDTSGQQALRN